MSAARDTLAANETGSAATPVDADRFVFLHADELLRSIVDASLSGMVVVDPAGVIAMTNPAVEELFGYDSGELVGQGVEVLVPPEVRTRHPDLRQSFLKSPHPRLMAPGRETFGVTKDGLEIEVELRLVPLSTSDGMAVLCMVDDLRAKKHRDLEMQMRLSDLQRHRVQMTVLGEMSSLLQHALDEREVFGIVGSYAERLFEGDPGGIYIIPASRNGATLEVAWGGFAGPDALELTECWGLRRTQIHVSDPVEPPRCHHVRDIEDVVAVCIPMSAHGQLVGMLTAAAPGAESDEGLGEIKAVGRAIADQLALALSNLQLRTKLRDLSIRDPLTRLFNRRFLEETVERELPRCRRHELPLSAMMIDVDHFKRFNDTHGHQAADEVLRSVARIIRESVRDEDVVCRYGGEEIVVLLPGCALDDAERVAEGLRGEVHRGTGEQVTVSIGVAAATRGERDWKSILGGADQAMYAAKTGGRNRVVVERLSRRGENLG